MAIDFPNSPSVNDQHTAAGITWKWDGTTWIAQGGTSSYVLPTASTTVKGGIKVGTNLGVAADASLNLNTSLTNMSSVGVVLSGSDWITANGTGLILSAASGAGYTPLRFLGNTVSDYVQFKNTAMTGQHTYTLPSALPASNGHVLSATTAGVLSWVAQSGGGSGTPEITWTLGASGSNHYTFTGNGFSAATNDPTLYLIRGQTYKFDNQTGGHPFRIQSTAASSGGGTAYNTGVTNNDATGGTATNVLTFVVPMDAPDTLDYQCTAHTSMTGTINVLTQGATTGLQSRSTGAATSTSLANNAAGNLTIVAAKTYALQKIQTSHAAWVTLYTDSTARTNDAARSETTDPLPGSGIIAEVITSDGATQPITPGAIGWNNDGTPSTNAYVKVVNKSGSTADVTVTLHFVAIEA